LESEAGAQANKSPRHLDFREMPVFVGFVFWWLWETPREIILITKKVVIKAFDFFSIDLLLKTLLLPWKRDEIDTTNLSLDDKLRVFMMNMVSRLVGAVVRGVIIVVGCGSIVATLLAGIFSLVFFLGLPIIAIYLIIISLSFSTY